MCIATVAKAGISVQQSAPFSIKSYLSLENLSKYAMHEKEGSGGRDGAEGVDLRLDALSGFVWCG
jgi:hypothetical protein